MSVYGPDLLGNALLSATVRRIHDQIVIIDEAPAGTVSVIRKPSNK